MLRKAIIKEKSDDIIKFLKIPIDFLTIFDIFWQLRGFFKLFFLLFAEKRYNFLLSFTIT